MYSLWGSFVQPIQYLHIEFYMISIFKACKSIEASRRCCYLLFVVSSSAVHSKLLANVLEETKETLIIDKMQKKRVAAARVRGRERERTRIKW